MIDLVGAVGLDRKQQSELCAKVSAITPAWTLFHCLTSEFYAIRLL